MASDLTGLFNTVSGSALTLLGSSFTADAYSSAGTAAVVSAQYNNAISRANFEREMDQMGRDIRDFMAQQTVATATTGFEGSSQTTLAVQNDALDTFGRMINDANNAQDQQEAAALFNAEQQQAAFENQASATRFSGFASAFTGITDGISKLSKGSGGGGSTSGLTSLTKGA